MGKKCNKKARFDYTKHTSVEVYNQLLSGRILKFPNNFVMPSNMKEIIRYVILEQQKLSREDICQNISYDYLKKYNLGGSKKAFNSNIFDLVKYCFPEMDIKYWELKKVKNGFWQQEENRKEFMLWLAKKERIDLSSLDDLKKIDARLIQRNGGSKALKYGDGLFSLIKLISKVEVKEWQVIKMRVCTEDKVKAAVKWLIEDKLKWSHDDVVRNISAKIFYEYDLGGLLSKYCDHSPIRALQIAYPGEYTKVRNSRPEYLRKS